MRYFLFRYFETWLYPIWVAITQMLTRKRNIRLPIFGSPDEIIERLQWGDKYRSEVVDCIYHPTWVESRIIEGKRVGDCDDHAVYWAQALERSDIATEVAVASLMYVYPNGKRAGHLLVLFVLDQRHFWADYNLPNEYFGEFDWAIQCAASRGVKLEHAAIFPVKRVTKGGRVVIGRGKAKKFHT